MLVDPRLVNSPWKRERKEKLLKKNPISGGRGFSPFFRRKG